MGHFRFRVVFILLVLILLVVSLVFGLLTYWLGAEGPPAPAPSQGNAESHAQDSPGRKLVNEQVPEIGILD